MTNPFTDCTVERLGDMPMVGLPEGVVGAMLMTPEAARRLAASLATTADTAERADTVARIRREADGA